MSLTGAAYRSVGEGSQDQKWLKDSCNTKTLPAWVAAHESCNPDPLHNVQTAQQVGRGLFQAARTVSPRGGGSLAGLCFFQVVLQSFLTAYLCLEREGSGTPGQF